MERNDVNSLFKKKEVPILVATDVAGQIFVQYCSKRGDLLMWQVRFLYSTVRSKRGDLLMWQVRFLYSTVVKEVIFTDMIGVTLVLLNSQTGQMKYTMNRKYKKNLKAFFLGGGELNFFPSSHFYAINGKPIHLSVSGIHFFCVKHRVIIKMKWYHNNWISFLFQLVVWTFRPLRQWLITTWHETLTHTLTESGERDEQVYLIYILTVLCRTIWQTW